MVFIITFMLNDHELPQRQSLRLQDYDYSQNGAYYVTVCVYNRACLLGTIVNGEIHLSETGKIVEQTWNSLACRFPTIELDAFIIMPNHLHGIILLGARSAPSTVGAGLALPNDQTPNGCQNQQTPQGSPTLGEVVGAFKSISAIACNRKLGRSGNPFWQRNYYEHIIRNEDDLRLTREYIAANPGHWAEDKENPAGQLLGLTFP